MAQDLALSPEGSEILFVVNNNRPLDAENIGKLLLALSRDYKAINRGRSLVVTNINTGSLYLSVTDAAAIAEPYLNKAVEIAKGAKAILDFGTFITNKLQFKKEFKGESDPVADNSPNRSIEAIIKIAGDTGSRVKIRYNNKVGESLEVDFTPSDAEELRHAMRRAELISKSPSDLQQLTSAQKNQLMATRAEEFADRIAASAAHGFADSQPIIVAVVSLLRETGNISLIEMLAVELAARGYTSLH